MAGKPSYLFKEHSVIIDESGYKICPEGRLHRVVYYHYFPETPKDWHIHHIDCNKLNNTLDNLIALPAAVHYKVHKEIKRTGRIITRPEFPAYLDQYTSVLQKVSRLEDQIQLLKKTLSKMEEEKKTLVERSGFGELSTNKKKHKHKSRRHVK